MNKSVGGILLVVLLFCMAFIGGNYLYAVIMGYPVVAGGGVAESGIAGADGVNNGAEGIELEAERAGTDAESELDIARQAIADDRSEATAAESGGVDQEKLEEALKLLRQDAQVLGINN